MRHRGRERTEQETTGRAGRVRRRAWLARALATGAGSDAVRGRALSSAGILAYQQADFPAARRLNEESLAIKRALGDRPGTAAMLHNVGLVAMEQGEHAEARALCE